MHRFGDVPFEPVDFGPDEAWAFFSVS